MKWKVEKASRVIDAIIGMAVAYFLVDTLWIDGSIDNDMIMPLYVGLVSILAYRTGIWSGRKIERIYSQPDKPVGDENFYRYDRSPSGAIKPNPPKKPMPTLKKPLK